jgi:hypothetical protein
MFIRLLVITGTLLFSLPAKTDTIFRYGLGIAGSAQDSSTETKFASLSYQDEWFARFLVYQYEGGFWTDTRQDLGRNGSWFGSAQGGIKVSPGSFQVSWLVGPTLITNTDSMLGGAFQFNNELNLALQDGTGASIGLSLKNFSSAGIYKVNQGRDFLLLRMAIPW